MGGRGWVGWVGLDGSEWLGWSLGPVGLIGLVWMDMVGSFFVSLLASLIVLDWLVVSVSF